MGGGGRDTRRRTRVLMLVPYPAMLGPLPKIVPLLVEQLRALGCDLDTERWSRHAEHESLREKVLGRGADLLRISDRLRRGRFDVLYITTAHDPAGVLRDVPLVLLSRLWCPHRVIQFHGSWSDRLAAPGGTWFKLASRVLVGSCDATLVLSGEEKQEWSGFCPRARVEVVANPFVPEWPPPEAIRLASTEAEGRPAGRYRGGTPTLLYVGRLLRDKGVLDLLRALAEVRTSTACRLLVAGEGPESSAMRKDAARLHIAGDVDLLGYVSGAGLRRCYELADVLVLPSYREGFPTVLLEAMSAGVPIVATGLRGAVGSPAGRRERALRPPRRPDLLARAVTRLLGDDELRAAMARRNLAKVAEFAPRAVAPRYLDIIESVAGVAGGRAPQRAGSPG